tara:strand:+ start:1724 stop:1837 length:114 start_codon:yes stop_codon:yes gene_type:complete
MRFLGFVNWEVMQPAVAMKLAINVVPRVAGKRVQRII